MQKRKIIAPSVIKVKIRIRYANDAFVIMETNLLESTHKLVIKISDDVKSTREKNLIFERFSRQNKYGIFGNTNIQETRSHGSNIQRQLTLLQEQTNTIKPKKTVCHTLSHQNALI